MVCCFFKATRVFSSCFSRFTTSSKQSTTSRASSTSASWKRPPRRAFNPQTPHLHSFLSLFFQSTVQPDQCFFSCCQVYGVELLVRCSASRHHRGLCLDIVRIPCRIQYDMCPVACKLSNYKIKLNFSSVYVKFVCDFF